MTHGLCYALVSHWPLQFSREPSGSLKAELKSLRLHTLPPPSCWLPGNKTANGTLLICAINKDAQIRATINQKLIETGERERLRELLRAKLIECGWRDQLKAHYRDVISDKGLEHVTDDDLVKGMTPKGRALVPDSVKKELSQRIRAFLA